MASASPLTFHHVPVDPKSRRKKPGRQSRNRTDRSLKLNDPRVAPDARHCWRTVVKWMQKSRNCLILTRCQMACMRFQMILVNVHEFKWCSQILSTLTQSLTTSSAASSTSSCWSYSVKSLPGCATDCPSAPSGRILTPFIRIFSSLFWSLAVENSLALQRER